MLKTHEATEGLETLKGRIKSIKREVDEVGEGRLGSKEGSNKFESDGSDKYIFNHGGVPRACNPAPPQPAVNIEINTYTSPRSASHCEGLT